MEKFLSDNIIHVKSQYATRIKQYCEKLDPSIPFHLNQIPPSERSEENSYFHVQYLENTKNFIDVQNYVDALCNEFEKEDKRKHHLESSCAGEDSSYDSDFEGSEDTRHDDVSRTVSDTLGAEFSEYVSVSHHSDSAYTSRVEFALKLGYTERLVQVALQKLGPNPEQNELLAELIKLGAQTGSKSKYDSDSYEDISEQYLPDPSGSVSSFTEPVKLRPIVIDGSNVAMSHGNKEVFSCRGIKICVDWFRARGHLEITVFVPKWRKESPRADNLVIDQDILYELEKERLLVFTPSREVRGKRMVCYDDRYILKLASENDGVVVSNDNYRDLIQECPDFRKVVEERILMYSFVNDRFMPPDDPLGRTGPILDNFLKCQPQKKTENCPYGKKCTYGNKCKYNHPERGLLPHKSVTERLVEHAQKQLQARNQECAIGKQLKGKSLSLPLQTTTTVEESNPKSAAKKIPLSRTKSTTFTGRMEVLEINRSNCENVDGISLDRSHYQIPSSTYNHQSTVWSPSSQIHSPQWPNQPLMSYNPAIMYHEQRGVMLNKKETDSGVKWASAKIDACDGTNLHRQLSRQLSINPTCDARLYQMQKFQQPDNHQNLTRHYSYQNATTLMPPPTHCNVTRIASAPPSNPPYTLPSTCNINSCSDSQLNLSTPQPYAPNWNNGVPTQNYPLTAASKDEARRKLHYHLASIFPEDQVDAAMRLYPNETNPQKICAAILSMFPVRT